MISNNICPICLADHSNSKVMKACVKQVFDQFMSDPDNKIMMEKLRYK
jgi:hypothetical protein